MRIAERGGFTLIELLAALSIAGFALLGGILLLDQISDASVRIASARVKTMRVANGARMLRRLLIDALPSADTTHGLAGEPRSVTLWTLCRTPQGWSKPCRVQLLLDQQRDSTVVTADLGESTSLKLLAVYGIADFRYIDSAQDTLWMIRWTSGLGLPSAVAIAATRDTIIYPLAVMHE